MSTEEQAEGPADGPAEAPADGPREEGSGRLRRALLRPARGQLVVAVLLAALAFAAVTQVRLTRSNDAYAGMRQADLITTLNGLTSASRRAEADINDLEKTRSALQDSSQKRSTALAQARTEAESLGILAGTVPAVGPGVEVTVQDSGHQLTVSHLLDGVQELRDSGAEAIQVNDRVRVIASTPFALSGDGILVGGVALRSPYTIEAIGDPGTLASGLTFQGGFVDDVKGDGGSVGVKQVDTIHVDAVRRAVPGQFAQPSGSG